MALDTEKLVAEFIEKFEVSTDPALWINLVKEEAAEVVEAAEHLLKELADVAYVVNGLGIALKANPGYTVTEEQPEVLSKALRIIDAADDMFNDKIVQEAFKRVHESNLSKLGMDGLPIRREDGKVLKGPNYKPADLSDLV